MSKDPIKIISAHWFTQHGIAGSVIGIVKCFDEITKETLWYIGNGTGKGIITDMERIKQAGARFYPDDYESFFTPVEITHETPSDTLKP